MFNCPAVDCFAVAFGFESRSVRTVNNDFSDQFVDNRSAVGKHTDRIVSVNIDCTGVGSGTAAVCGHTDRIVSAGNGIIGIFNADIDDTDIFGGTAGGGHAV